MKSTKDTLHFTLEQGGIEALKWSIFFIFHLIANLSFNFNYNLVKSEISFTLQFSNHPPTQPPNHPPTHRKSSDISAVTDQILMKL